MCKSSDPLHHYKIFLCQFFHGEVPGKKKTFYNSKCAFKKKNDKNQGIKIQNVAVSTSFFYNQDWIRKWSKEIYHDESEQKASQAPNPTCLCQNVSLDNLTSKKYVFDKNMAFNLSSTG